MFGVNDRMLMSPNLTTDNVIYLFIYNPNGVRNFLNCRLRIMVGNRSIMSYKLNWKEFGSEYGEIGLVNKAY